MTLLKIIFVLIFILCFIQGKAEYNHKQYTRTTTPFFQMDWNLFCFQCSVYNNDYSHPATAFRYLISVWTVTSITL